MTENSCSTTGCAFIIRGWPEPGKETEHPQWRFRVRNLLNDNQYGFVSLEELLVFLRREFGDIDYERSLRT